MKTLFNNSLNKLLLRFQPQQQPIPIKSKTIQEIVVKEFKSDVPYSKLCRLPTSEVKTMLKVPCPLSTQLTPADTAEHTAVFKRIRYQFNVEEEPVCSKCQRQCPVRNIPFKQLNYQLQTSNKSALHDLLLFAISLQKMPENSYSQLRWSAAYKTMTSLEILLRDFKILGRESLLYREVMKHLEALEKKNMKQTEDEQA